MIHRRHNSGLGFAWAVAAPLIASGASSALMALLGRQKPQQKVATTDIVNGLEPVLQQNLADWEASPKTASHQAHHLSVFDGAWAWLISPEACGTPKLGEPGHWCIADRNRGGQWDWFSRYRDPIANDPAVVPDPSAGEAFQQQLTTELAPIMPAGVDVQTLLIAGALIVGGLLL